MTAQLEVVPDPLDHVLRGGGSGHPLLKHALAQPLAAGADQNDDPALADGVARVVQRLLRLVQVQILGRAALTDQHDVRRSTELLEIDRVEKGAQGPVGRSDVAGGGTQDLLVLAQHHVEDEIRAAHGGGLLNVGADGIGGDVARAGLGPDHHGVVRLDRRAGGDAGHNGLGAAGIAGKIVVLHIAQTDTAVGLGHNAGDVHRRAGPGETQVHAVVRIAVHTADLGPGALAGQTALFLVALMAVTAQTEDKRDVLGAHARGVQLVQQGGHDLGGGHGTGHIAGDHGDLLTGADDLRQTGRADGLAQRAADLPVLGGGSRHGRCPQDPDQVFIRYAHALRARTDPEFQIHVISSGSWPWPPQ